MTAIDPSDVSPGDHAHGLRIIAYAKTIAPSLDDLEDTARPTAMATLRGAAAEIPAPGTRRLRGQSRNGTSISLDPYLTAFTREDRAALRALCGMPALSEAARPVGHFPPSGIVQETWPEKRTRA